MSDFPLPEAFLERMRSQLGGAYSAFAEAMEAEPTRGLRWNALKPVDGADADGALDAVPWASEGRYLAPGSLAGAHPLHEAGAYYIQDPAAMLPVAVLDPRPGENVLDLCAAPGGKSTQIAQRMAGQGLLVCNEPVPKRTQVLSRNIERMGVMNAVVVSSMPEQLAACWAGGFDAVLVDAPCSGEGMFRRHPETRAEWSPEMAAGCAERQAAILDEAARLVRRGGRLVYATCTYNPQENEDNVRAFLARHPDFSLRPFSLPGAAAESGMLTCYPHRMRGEGQFAALLTHGGEEAAELPANSSLPRPTKAQRELLRAFAKDAPEAAVLFGDTLVSLPLIPDLKGIRVLRVGLHLGQAKGRLFTPDHAWAMAALPPACPRVPLDEAQARAYQAGEVLRMDGLAAKGYVLPTLAGLPLGFGKASDGQIKNHYPKGLRRPLRSDAP